MTSSPAAPIPTARPFVLRGWHVLIAFVVFFGVDIAVNTYFMVSAYETYPGETSVTPYEDGVAYNATLREKRAQARLGWRLTAGLDPAGALRVEAFDAAGAPLPGLRVAAHVERPATEAGQRDLALRETAAGVYEGRTAPVAGTWDVTVTARDSTGHLARAERRIDVT